MYRASRSVVAVVLLFLFCLPALANAADFRFTKSTGVRPVAVLTAEEFEAKFGDNAAMPRSDEAVLALARKLFRPHWIRQYEATWPEVGGDNGCGEEEVGRLFAALANPAVSNAAREEVDALYAESIPPLPKTYASGKFKILYTTSDPNPDNNVTAGQVQTLANWLNSNWTAFVGSGFAEPKHYHWSGTLPRIEVKVYYLGASLYGQTSSAWNHMELNSKHVVRDSCKVRTTPAHELFHRVEYSYGYVSGTANMAWIVEGTSSWSQRFVGYSIGDYMRRMNQGLTAPDLDLITSRGYNACHLWVFLEQRAGTYAAVRQVWRNFSAAAVKNSAAAKAALDTYTKGKFGAAWNFDYFTAWWNQANLYKDFNNAGVSYEYSEDERVVTSCGVTYGPLSNVPRTTGVVTSNSSPTVTKTGSVSANGADYYQYTIGPGVTHVKVVADGQAGKSFNYRIGVAKSNNWSSYVPSVGENYTYTKNFTAGAYDKLSVVVVGNSSNGAAAASYTLRIGP